MPGDDRRVWKDEIEQAADRNHSVELQYHTRHGELLVAKSRILGYDDDYVYLDQPQSIGQETRFHVDQKVDGFVLVDGMRYTFKSVVRALRCIVHLNDTKAVVGIVINRPRRILPGQRRTAFRVSVLGDEPIILDLHAALSDVSGACPVDCHPYRGALTNLSVAGAAIRIKRQDVRNITVNELVFMTFRLPAERDEFYFLAEVRRMTAIDGSTDVRMGVKIKPWPSPLALSRMQTRLQRYINDIQRRHLRPAG